jgi:hypothetical protein
MCAGEATKQSLKETKTSTITSQGYRIYDMTAMQVIARGQDESTSTANK